MKQTASDGKTTYDVLPVSLGAVRGYKTSIQISTVPGSPQAAGLRKELIEGVDGIVFVADLRPERHDATLASAGRAAPAPFGAGAQDRGRAARPAVQPPRPWSTRTPSSGCTASSASRAPASRRWRTTGTGVLQTLTTLSKLVLGELRKALDEASAAAHHPAEGARASPAVDPLEPPTGTARSPRA